MIRVEENQLNDILNKFYNSSIKMSFEGILNGKISFYKCMYECDTRSGKLIVKDRKNSIKIDIFTVYKILIDENYTTIDLYMDYDLKIRIEKL